jgi:hypothetical protein
MKTDDLIKALAQDLPTKPPKLSQTLTQALIVSVPIAFGILIYAVQVRPDLLQVLATPRIAFKFAFTAAVIAASGWLALRLSRPGMVAGPARWALGLVGLIVVGSVGLELAVLPASAWSSAWIGTRALACLALIPVLAAVPFAAILAAMRAGAPDHPALAGASAGLLAGSLGAFLYAMHCDNDSPLFVATWYGLAMLAITLLGAAIGSRILRW